MNKKEETGTGKGGSLNFSNLVNNKEVLSSNNSSGDKKRTYNVKPKPKKSSIRLFINKDAIDDFSNSSHDFFLKNDARHENSNANYLKLILRNLNDIFISKYGKLEILKEKDLIFLKTRGKRNSEYGDYSNDIKFKVNTSFTLEVKVIDFLYQIAFTFFINERKDLKHYSISFFFYDILKMLNNIDLKYYNKEEINNFFGFE